MQEKHPDPREILRAIALRDLDTLQNILMSLASWPTGWTRRVVCHTVCYDCRPRPPRVDNPFQPDPQLGISTVGETTWT